MPQTRPSAYGYRNDRGVLAEVPGERAVIARARELGSEGLSRRGVGRVRLEEGYQPRTGKG